VVSTLLSKKRERLDGMLDLQGVPSTERWNRIHSAVLRLDGERAGDWRLKVLLPDTPEEAGLLPHLMRQLAHSGLAHDSVREPGGGQGIVIAPARAPALAATA
jgi:hypothetical protein